MKKLWRLLMASTVLSGLAGLGMAHAATDVALPRTNDAGQASIILAQAVSPEDAARTKQQQQRRDERQQQRQNTQKPDTQKPDTRKPATASPPPPPATRASPPPPPATRASPPPPPATRASPPPPPAARDRSTSQPGTADRERQDRNRATSPASPPPPPAGAKPASPPPPAAATTAPRDDRGRNQNQGRDRDPNRNQTTKPADTTPAARGGAATDPRSAPLTRSGNPAPAADVKPIEPAGKGRGVAVRSGDKEIRSVNELKSERRETREGNRTVIREPDRTIIKDGNNKTIIRHDENNRFRVGARDVRVERRGNENVTIIVRPGGERIVTVVDSNGFLLRRSRFLPDGREIIIIDNRPRAGMRVGNFFVILPPPRIRIPRDRYIVAYRGAPPALIYDTLMAPPVDVIERPYSLDEIRYSAPVRDRMPRIDLDDITFETGSWELAPEQIDKLAPIADGMKRAIEANPQAVFLIEGHTDAVGDENDNLSLSDRRAESVAVALTEQFQVPAENLSTQGYGEQQLKVPTDGPEEANRRVTVRNIAPLLAGRNPPDQPAPR